MSPLVVWKFVTNGFFRPKLEELLQVDEIDPEELKACEPTGQVNSDLQNQINELKSILLNLTTAAGMAGYQNNGLRVTSVGSSNERLSSDAVSRPVGSVSEIIGVLPEYDPLKETIASNNS